MGTVIRDGPVLVYDMRGSMCGLSVYSILMKIQVVDGEVGEKSLADVFRYEITFLLKLSLCSRCHGGDIPLSIVITNTISKSIE